MGRIDITYRQWSYVCSRLEILPQPLLDSINCSHPQNVRFRLIELDLYIRNKLQLSLAELLTECESVLNIVEMAKIVGIGRCLTHYRYRKYHIRPVTVFPVVFFSIHDIWAMIERPDLAKYFKANPIYKWRTSNHYSIYQAASKLKLSRLQLTILESKGLHPSIYNDLKTKHNKPTNNKNDRSLQPTFADNPADRTKVELGKKPGKKGEMLAKGCAHADKLSTLRTAISKHCGAATLAALLRWQRKKIR